MRPWLRRWSDRPEAASWVSRGVYRLGPQGQPVEQRAEGRVGVKVDVGGPNRQPDHVGGPDVARDLQTAKREVVVAERRMDLGRQARRDVLGGRSGVEFLDHAEGLGAPPGASEHVAA